MKKHQLLRLTSSLYGKPHLISKEGFESVTQYLHARNKGLISFDSEETDVIRAEELSTAGKIGVIDIMGPLTYRSTGWEAMCGGMSYEMLVEKTTALLDAGCTSIVMNIDSGGGQAYGAFESANEVRALADAAGAKLYAYVDGMAASAAYAIACVADEVVCNPYGSAGSIGVLVALYNDSKALEQEGVERIFVTDGEQKVPFAADGSFKQEFLDDLQSSVSKLGDSFRAHVAQHTGLSTEDLKNTQAKVFDAEEALKLGLVNKIMTRNEFASYVTQKEN